MTTVAGPIRFPLSCLLFLSMCLLASRPMFAAPVFGTPSHIAVPSAGTMPTSIALADFNHDGKPDMVVASVCATAGCTGGFLSVFQGKGDGTFESPVNIYANCNPLVVQTGDFNNDGNPDLILLTTNSSQCPGGFGSSVQVLLGNGDGTFSVLPPTFLGPIGDPLSMTVGDFNGDGVLDVAVADGCTYQCLYLFSNLYVALGKGDGSFRPAIQTINPVGKVPNDLVAADFNGDGKSDLAIISSNMGNVYVELSKGDGMFVYPGSTFHTGAASSITAADINKDGVMDLVISAPPVVRIAYGNGDGTFQKPIGLNTAPDNYLDDYPYQTFHQVVTGDFNGDGQLDIAVVGFDLDELFVYVQRSGNFAEQIYSTSNDVLTPAGPGKLAAGDLNGDGADDAVVLNVYSNDIAVFLSTAVAPQ